MNRSRSIKFNIPRIRSWNHFFTGATAGVKNVTPITSVTHENETAASHHHWTISY